MELLAQLLDKNVSWLIAASLLVALVTALIRAWRQKNGEGNKDVGALKERLTMLEHKVTESTALLHALEHGVGEATKTVNRLQYEMAIIRGKLSVLVRNIEESDNDST
jgi:uncharacterized coiled-coil protein SlyX